MTPSQLAMLLSTHLMHQTDPYWSTREPTWHYHPKPRPPPDPDPLSHPPSPFHHPLQYAATHQVHHPTLHRLSHLHTLESRHLRFLALHRRLPLKVPIHLLLHFCPTIPPEPVPPWTDEGGFAWSQAEWSKPTTTLQVHPTVAKFVRASPIQQLAHTFRSAVGFSVTDQFDESEALDTASKPFGIDPMASATISNNKDEFIGLRPLSKTYLAGVGGKVPVEGIGTLIWDIEDDLGMTHQVKIDDAYYCSQAPLRLLCPQQWAAQREKQIGPDHNTTFVTQAHFSRLTWSEYTLTVRHDAKTNLPLWRTAPGYRKVAMNVATKPVLDPSPAIVSDDEDSLEDEEMVKPKPIKRVHFPFSEDQQLPTQCQDTNVDEALSKDQIELLKLHNKYGHASFQILKNMANQGLIPRKYSTIDPPKCSSCMYGKQTKRPWRTKAKPTPIGGRKPTEPGQCVSVDQMISKTPGLIAQVKGWLTKKRYQAATVFADHASGLTYVHVSEGTTAEETLEAKSAFESYAAEMGVSIKHYHADNGRFAEAAFMEHVKASGQTITFCGVGAHHQNGVAERRIRDLTEHARTMLLHAAHRWPKAINVHLWPYALRLAAHIRNHVPRESEGGIPIQTFSGTSAQNKVFTKHQHTFVSN